MLTNADIAAVRAKVWQLAVGAVGLALAALLLLGQGYVIGAVVLAASVAWTTYRLEFVDAGPAPGAFSFGRAKLDAVRAAIVAVVLGVVCILLFVAAHERWTRDFRGQVGSFALCGLAFFLLLELQRVTDSANNRFDGGFAEQRVVDSLKPLADEGWQIQNNLLRDDGWGDIDIVLQDRDGRVFAIETKSGALRRKHVRQALDNAAWLKRHTNVRWVNAVVCIPGDTPARPDGKAWIVGSAQIADWLRTARI